MKKIVDDKKNHYTLLSYQHTSGSILDDINGKFITILGENTITIDEHTLTKIDTVLDVVSILGSTIIYVPEDIILETYGDYLLGDLWVEKTLKNSYVHNYHDDGTKRKRIIVLGNVFLGEINIRTKREKMTLGQKIKRLLTGGERSP